MGPHPHLLPRSAGEGNKCTLPHAMNHSGFESLPVLGAGIGLRKQHFNELKKTDLPVGWLEIVPENFMNFGGFPQAMLDLCARLWPIVSHGVNLSIGSVDPLNEEYV